MARITRWPTSSGNSNCPAERGSTLHRVRSVTPRATHRLLPSRVGLHDLVQRHQLADDEAGLSVGMCRRRHDRRAQHPLAGERHDDLGDLTGLGVEQHRGDAAVDRRRPAPTPARPPSAARAAGRTRSGSPGRSSPALSITRRERRSSSAVKRSSGCGADATPSRTADTSVTSVVMRDLLDARAGETVTLTHPPRSGWSPVRQPMSVAISSSWHPARRRGRSSPCCRARRSPSSAGSAAG